jgi:hypothetical protein
MINGWRITVDLDIETSLAAAVEFAKNLTDASGPGGSNDEYIRGQTNLLVDLFGLPSHANKYLYEAITGRTSISSMMNTLSKLTDQT